MSKSKTIMGKRCKEAIPAGCSSTSTAPSATIYPNANIEDCNNNCKNNSIKIVKTRHSRLPKGIHFDKDDIAVLHIQLDENPKPPADDLMEFFNFEEYLKEYMKPDESLNKVDEKLFQLDKELVTLKIQVQKNRQLMAAQSEHRVLVHGIGPQRQ